MVRKIRQCFNRLRPPRFVQSVVARGSEPQSMIDTPFSTINRTHRKARYICRDECRQCSQSHYKKILDMVDRLALAFSSLRDATAVTMQLDSSFRIAMTFL